MMESKLELIEHLKIEPDREWGWSDAHLYYDDGKNIWAVWKTSDSLIHKCEDNSRTASGNSEFEKYELGIDTLIEHLTGKKIVKRVRRFI